MAVRKDTKSGKWLAEAYVKGKRIRKLFDSKVEANRFYNALKNQNSPFYQLIQVKTPIRLSEMVKSWWEFHGQYLGERAWQVKERLERIVQGLNDPYAEQFSVEQFTEYRRRRLNGEIIFDRKNRAVTISTANMELRFMKAMINELIRLKKWKWENPLKELREFKQKEIELSFLRTDEIKQLLLACKNISNDLFVIVQICLSTGARWNEVQQLKSSQVIPYKITFIKTKGGKNRTIPISSELFELIPKRQGQLFPENCYDRFKKALRVSNIELPKGQSSHVLRHTFASHFMMNGGNILVLKDILGHSNINMTMRYAHFSPSHLEAAIMLNPLQNMDK